MARTSSQSLTFWQFEVGLFNDMKMVDLNEKYGTLGEAVYFRILSYIANSEGYYAVLSDSLILSIYRSIGSKWLRDKRVILRIIDYCGECGLFDVNLLRQNVITSCGIQRRWLYAKEKARAKGFTTDRFWLLDDQGFDKCTKNYNKCSNNIDKCDNNIDKCNNNSTISKVKKSKEPPNPLQGGGEKNWKDRFFERFTVFEKKNYKDDGIDYEVLYKEFEKSCSLQKIWSFPKIISLYKQIANGDFRDKETDSQRIIRSTYERAEMERYYTAKRVKAESIAERYLLKANSNNEYKSIATELSKMEIALAKAELSELEKLPALQEKKRNLLARRKEVLQEIGILEAQLQPQYECKKCSDTGFLPSGAACTCYTKE